MTDKELGDAVRVAAKALSDAVAQATDAGLTVRLNVIVQEFINRPSPHEVLFPEILRLV